MNATRKNVISPLADAVMRVLDAQRRGGFSPSSLFVGGFQGWWYDFSDMSTLFQDSAGSTPVTAVEQPIGRVLDKSGNGNHSIQATGSKKPTLSARKNLSVKTEDLSAVEWLLVNVSQSSSGTINGLPAFKVVPSTSNVVHQTTNNNPPVSVNAVTISLYAKADGYSKIGIKESNAVGGYATFNLSTGVVITQNSGTGSIENIGGGVYRVSYSTTLVSANAGRTICILDDGYASGDPNGRAFVGDGTSGVLVSGLQTEHGLVATRYQRVTTATDYDTVGFPHYARFDGVDDALGSAASVDFTAGDKMTAFTAYSTTTSAFEGWLAELSANSSTNNGSFYVRAGGTASYDNHIVVGLRGTAHAAIADDGGLIGSAGRVPDNTPLYFTTAFDIAGANPATEIINRFNGVALPVSGSTRLAVTGTDAGTGNFGTYPFYHGSRAGTGLYFNGPMYQSIAVNKTASATEITNSEAFISKKLGLS